ncbi:uncharacterized protein [Eurosta solidaginis]|uniref:uncharacterized protein n=1 Tax=Eurosta solidaginis TaxID=178769 RepID=UPI003531573E
MLGKIFGLCIFLVVAPSTLGQKCGECMPNYALCVNRTSFQICTGDTATSLPIDDEIYNCAENEVCTNSNNICEATPDKVNIISVCDESPSTSSCSSCNGKSPNAMVCLSATQFALCRNTSNGLAPSNPLACPNGQFCSESLMTQHNLKKVCGPQAILDYFETAPTCPLVGVVTPSTEAPTAATEADVSDICADNKNKTGSYFQVKNPEDCRSYVYCERDVSSGGFISLDMKCRAGQAYSEAQNRCITSSTCLN